MYIVDDPYGTPADNAATAEDIVTKAHGLSNGAVVSVNTGTMTTADVTATASELNVLDGITATTAELNYTDGATSNIQTQINEANDLAVALAAAL
jgi:hypothetical protein